MLNCYSAFCFFSLPIRKILLSFLRILFGCLWRVVVTFQVFLTCHGMGYGILPWPGLGHPSCSCPCSLCCSQPSSCTVGESEETNIVLSVQNCSVRTGNPGVLYYRTSLKHSIMPSTVRKSYSVPPETGAISTPCPVSFRLWLDLVTILYILIVYCLLSYFVMFTHI